MDKEQRTYSIVEFAEMIGVNPQTIRYWVKQGNDYFMGSTMRKTGKAYSFQQGISPANEKFIFLAEENPILKEYDLTGDKANPIANNRANQINGLGANTYEKLEKYEIDVLTGQNQQLQQENQKLRSDINSLMGRLDLIEERNALLQSNLNGLRGSQQVQNGLSGPEIFLKLLPIAVDGIPKLINAAQNYFDSRDEREQKRIQRAIDQYEQAKADYEYAIDSESEEDDKPAEDKLSKTITNVIDVATKLMNARQPQQQASKIKGIEEDDNENGDEDA